MSPVKWKKSLSARPSGSPLAAPSFAGSTGSNASASLDRMEVGTATIARFAATRPRAVSIRMSRPR